MADEMETARRLLSLATHDGTPEHERTAAAVALARLIARLGILDGARSGVAIGGAPVEDTRVRSPDVPADDGMVILGESRPCRACVLRRYPPRVRARKPSVIRTGEKARLFADGHYAHVDCANEYAVLSRKGVYR